MQITRASEKEIDNENPGDLVAFLCELVLIVFYKEYEREMKSYGIPVKEFTVQDMTDMKDIKAIKSEHFHHKEVNSTSICIDFHPN